MTKHHSAAVALMLIVALMAGCDDIATTEETTPPGAVSPSVDGTAPLDPDLSLEATVGDDASDQGEALDDGSASADPLPAPDDSEAISRELETIIRELDEMSMPEDTDFSTIEDALD